MRPRTQNSPVGHKIATHKHPGRWKRDRMDGNDAYIPQNTSTEALEMQNQKIALGRVVEVLGMVERISGTVEGELRGFQDLESRSTHEQIAHICAYLVGRY